MRIDTIIESERVFTGAGDAAQPAAVAIAGDRIAAVGPKEDVRAFAREANAREGAPEVHDFGDALVVPGFHDSHLHFFHSAIYSSPFAAMFTGENEADCVERLRGRTAGCSPRGGASTAGIRPSCPRSARSTRRSPTDPQRCTRAMLTHCG